MMDRDDVIDLLAIISTVDNRQVTDADIIVWHEHLERYDKDECLDAVMRHQRQSTVWIQPAHVVELVRSARNDAIDRADPDDRPHMVGLNGVPRDRYGYQNKGEDDDYYPSDWTAEQRVAASWEAIRRRRDEQERMYRPLNPKLPAASEVRSHAMQHIRDLLAHR